MSSLRDLQAEHDLISKKIHRLRMRFIIETDEAERFKLEHQINEAEGERDRIVQQLEGTDQLVLTCPYRGLFAFREQDADIFFGRETYIRRLIKEVQHHTLMAVVGPSGSGKSSVVFAGLLPELQRKRGQQVTSCRPLNAPFRKLAEALVPCLDPQLSETKQLIEIGELANALQERTLTLHNVAERILRNNPTVDRLLLVIDQFEELYTLCTEETVRQAFLNDVLAACQAPLSSQSQYIPALTVILTLRADFMEQVLSYRPFADALQDAIFNLGPMTHEELQQAIERPAKNLDVEFETGLAERILEDIEDEPGSLPLLEFALTLLWERQTARKLTHTEYNKIGQVKGALARHADDVYANLLREFEEKQLQRVFVQMVRPGEGTEDTRRLANRKELDEEQWGLVQRMADSRLLVTNRGPSGEETVEVVHESLIRGWGQLRQWMNEVRRFRIWQERLRTALSQWEESKRDVGALLRGRPLAEAEGWLAERKMDLSRAEQAFIQASISRERRRKRILTGVVACVVLILIVALSAVFFMWQTSERQTRIGQSRDLAELAQSVIPEDPQRSALVSIEALNVTLEKDEIVLETRETLSRALAEVGGYVLYGHMSAITAVAVSPDSHWLITASEDERLQLWDLTADDPTAHPITMDVGVAELSGLAFSADTHWLLSIHSDEIFRLWDLTAEDPSAHSIKLNIDTEKLSGFTFSLDTHWLITANEDESLQLWDLTAHNLNVNPIPLNVNVHLEFEVFAISPDAHWLVSTNDEGTVRIWDLHHERLDNDPFILSKHAIMQPFNTVPNAFLLPDDTNSIKPFVMSPDSGWVITNQEDGTARIWNLHHEDPTAAPVVLRHTERLIANTISPDSRWLVTFSNKPGNIILWDLHSDDPSSAPVIVENKDTVMAIAISTQWLAVAGEQGAVRLWNLSVESPGSSSPLRLREHEKEITVVVVSPDNHWLATGSNAGTVRLWDLSAWNLTQGVHRNIIQLKNRDILTKLACRMVSRNLSQDEWQLYLPGRPYRKTCPNLPDDWAERGEYHFDKAKRYYETAVQSENPLPSYEAALKELDVVIAQDNDQWEAYAVKGLIYRRRGDLEQAIENLSIAKQGSFGKNLQWVPLVLNIVYGENFHARAADAIRSGEWERAKKEQESAMEFFNTAIKESFTRLEEVSQTDQSGMIMKDIYINAQERWVTGTFQMAVIAGSFEKDKERQRELLEEAMTRLREMLETYPDATALRYYLADGYRKQALTLRTTDPEESQRLQEQAMTQLRTCAELGLPRELRNPAAQLFSILSEGSEPEIEQKLLTTLPVR